MYTLVAHVVHQEEVNIVAHILHVLALLIIHCEEVPCYSQILMERAHVGTQDSCDANDIIVLL